MLQLFVNNLLPVLLVAATGYVLAARTRLDVRPMSVIAFSVLAPCFVFKAIVDSGVAFGALVRMLGFAMSTLLALGAGTALLGRALGWSRARTTAATLVAMLPNAGNYGLSANLFAFGAEGLAQASLYFVASSILTFTAGVLIASLGRSRSGAAAAGLVKVPAVWAVVLAMALLALGWRLPLPVQRALDVLSGACIPMFLLILGMQLQGRGVRSPWRPVLAVSAVRLLGGAAAGTLGAAAFGLEGVARQAGILQSAMPSAVINTILATEYDVDPEFVTSVVVVTTLATPLTLTPLLAYLGA